MADEVHRLQNGKDDESRLFQGVAEKGHYGGRTRPTPTRQGIYALTPSGMFLGSINTRRATHVQRMLEEALAKWSTLDSDARRGQDGHGVRANRVEYRYPDDGLVLQVFTRDLPRDRKFGDWRGDAWNQDFAWFTRDEAAGFLPADPKPGDRHVVPKALVERLSRCHLIDNVRGQTSSFPQSAVRVAELTATVTGIDGDTVSLKLEGRSKTSTKGSWTVNGLRSDKKSKQQRGYDARLLGRATFDRRKGRFAAFDLCAIGERTGGTRYNARGDDLEPSPMGVALVLAKDTPQNRVPPAHIWSYGRAFFDKAPPRPRPSKQAAGPGSWLGFRGTYADAKARGKAPLTWGDDNNLRWKAKLPGPGRSSPIVLGDSVFITCWSGYGLDAKDPGDPKKLRRHLLRLDRHTGKVVWTKEIPPVATEDPFGGRMSTHGYASQTPVSDGHHVFAFFGKSGVYCFDFEGNQVWHADVGRKSSQWVTGSGSSLAVSGDLLYVNASDESQSIRALDKRTGKEVWKRQTETMDQAYGTPLVHGNQVILAILGEVWGLHARTGELLWSVKTKTIGALAQSVIRGDKGVVYSFGGRGRERSYRIKLGATDGSVEPALEWRARWGAYVATPLLHDGHLYWIDEGGFANCVDASTGEPVYKERVDGGAYASPVLADGKIYVPTRVDGTYVLAASPKFEVLAHNTFETDASSFDGTVAISRGQLFIRSLEYLYCIEE